MKLKSSHIKYIAIVSLIIIIIIILAIYFLRRGRGAYDKCKGVDCGQFGKCDTSTGSCICNENYYGVNCQNKCIASADDIFGCNAHGTCNVGSGNCDCFKVNGKGWEGNTCNECEEGAILPCTKWLNQISNDGAPYFPSLEVSKWIALQTTGSTDILFAYNTKNGMGAWNIASGYDNGLTFSDAINLYSTSYGINAAVLPMIQSSFDDGYNLCVTSWVGECVTVLINYNIPAGCDAHGINQQPTPQNMKYSCYYKGDLAKLPSDTTYVFLPYKVFTTLPPTATVSLPVLNWITSVAASGKMPSPFSGEDDDEIVETFIFDLELKYKNNSLSDTEKKLYEWINVIVNGGPNARFKTAVMTCVNGKFNECEGVACSASGYVPVTGEPVYGVFTANMDRFGNHVPGTGGVRASLHSCAPAYPTNNLSNC